MAGLANGAVLIRYGDTVLLVTATMSQTPREGTDFFPLTIDFEERLYAAGKIPGGWFRREGRPSTAGTLAARLTDRPLRPLFPKGMRNDVQCVVTTLSVDLENAPDILSIIGASAALTISDIPFGGPVSGTRMGYRDGEYLVNPTYTDLETSSLDIVVAGTKDAIVMVEAGATEVSEEILLEAMKRAQDVNAQVIALQEEMQARIGKPKSAYVAVELTDEIKKTVVDFANSRNWDLVGAGKDERGAAMQAVRKELVEALGEQYPANQLKDALEEHMAQTIRGRILDDGVRPDGRKTDEIRPINVEVGLLPRTHGSALFTRGQTQALVVATLGSVDDEQRMDNIDSPKETTKSFLLHYNFPPFSTGEVRPMRGTSRREIGHGVLAERAITPLLPEYKSFPYTIRIVSETLESNGSSSMAAVCGSSLSLMDAGVPLKAACAGVAMGLIKEGDKVAILTDILGTEDALGDMDFKVAGTEQGITAIQMDIKIQGLSLDIMAKALDQARRARLHILKNMAKTLSAQRTEMSPWAPRIITIQVRPKDIGKIIGPKGANIREIEAVSGAKVSIDDDGVVTIAAVGGEAGNKAREMVEGMVQEAEIGRTYTGKVKSTTAFGAFVEILPGLEGLLHISELQHGRTDKTEDVVKKGDVVEVKVLEIDERGKMRLSRTALLPKS